MNIYFTALSNFIDLALILLFINTTNNNKVPLYKVMFLVPMLIVMTFVNGFHSDLLNLTMFYIAIFVITWFPKEFKFSFVLSTLYIIIRSTSEMITVPLVNDICKMPLSTTAGSVSFIIINSLLKYSTLFLYSPVKSLLKDDVFFKSMVPIIILPLSFVFIIAGTSEKLDFMNIYFKIGTILLLISNFVIMYVAYKVNESEKLRIKLYDNKIKEDINKLYYELIEQKYNANRIYIHDLNKHINILNAMMTHEQYTDMKLYLQTMFEVSKKMSNQIYSGNKTLDLVLSNINEKYDTSNISFSFEKIENLTFKSLHLYDDDNII